MAWNLSLFGTIERFIHGNIRNVWMIIHLTESCSRSLMKEAHGSDPIDFSFAFDKAMISWVRWWMIFLCVFCFFERLNYWGEMQNYSELARNNGQDSNRSKFPKNKKLSVFSRAERVSSSVTWQSINSLRTFIVTQCYIARNAREKNTRSVPSFTSQSTGLWFSVEFVWFRLFFYFSFLAYMMCYLRVDLREGLTIWSKAGQIHV